MNKYKCIIGIIILLIFILYLNNFTDNFSNNFVHPINKYFDSVNVISVPKRKKYMTNIMKLFNIDANIIDATLVKDIDYNELINNNFVSIDYYKGKNKGRIACHLSQIKLIKNFLNSSDDTIFIFEDDISIGVPNNYKNIIEDSMKNIPNDWDIVFFGRCWDNCKEMKKISNNLYQVFRPLCRHAYGLSKKGAGKILKYTTPMVNNGDEMYKENIQNGNIIAYAIHPSIFSQNRVKLGSNLGNDIKKIRYPIFSFYKLKEFLKKNKKKFVEYPPTCT